MECRDARELLTAHVDGELRGRDALDVAHHLDGCADCAAARDALLSLRRAVGAGATRYHAPATLVHRVRAALPSSPAPDAGPQVAFWRRWAAVGAFASFVAVGMVVGLLVMQPSSGDLLADEIVSSHVRSLLSDRAIDVASSDRHTVKPWFSGKLDYSPPVYDLADDGFRLEGGRVDYVDHRPVAALVYRRHQHTINLYVLPAAAGAADSVPLSDSRRGLNLLRWVRHGMAYWAISDVEPAELALFHAALVARD